MKLYILGIVAPLCGIAVATRFKLKNSIEYIKKSKETNQLLRLKKIPDEISNEKKALIEKYLTKENSFEDTINSIFDIYAQQPFFQATLTYAST